MTAQAAPGSVPAERVGNGRLLLLTSYWAALGFLWLPLGSFVLPLLILHAVGDSFKGTGVAILEGVGTLMAVFWQPIMGSVSDRTTGRHGRRRPYIVVGTLGSLVFLLLMIATPGGASSAKDAAVLLAPAYLYLFALYALLQFSENAAQAPYQGLMADVVPEEQRSRLSGFVGGGQMLGLAIGFAVVGTFTGMHRFDLALLSMVVVLGASMVVVVLLFPDRARPAAEVRTRWQDVVFGTFAISPREHADFLWLMASRLAVLMSLVGLQRFALYYFKDVYFPGKGQHLEDLAALAARDLQVVIVLVAFLVSFPAAELSHRTGRKPMIMLSAVLGALGTAGLLVSAYRVLPDFMVNFASGLFGVPPLLSQALYFGLLLGIATGAFLSVDWAFMLDVIPADEAGRFLGFSNIATAGAGVIAGFVGGFLIDFFNHRGQIFGEPGGYPATFLVYVFFFVCGGLAILKVRETRGRRRPLPAAIAAAH
jgi:MFS family permease